MENVMTPAARPDEMNHAPTGAKKTVCFVCTGNTCRSPMAAALYRERHPEDRAVSAGLAASDGEGLSEGALYALRAAGVPEPPDGAYSLHRAHTVTEEDMRSADLVVGLTARHAMALIRAFPEMAGKITSFCRDIPDPYGGDEAVYRRCLTEIRLALEEMFP